MTGQQDKVSRGQPWDPLDADVHNDIIQTTIESKLRKTNAEGDFSSSPERTVLYKNIRIAAPSQMFSVVGYGAPLHVVTDLSGAANTKYQNIVWSEGTPAAGRWAITHKQTVLANGLTKAVYVGETWAMVNVTDVNHSFADIVGGNLESTESGYAWIRSAAGGTGLQWCLLQLGFNPSETNGGSTQSQIDALEACLCALKSFTIANTAAPQAEVDALNAECTVCEIETVLCGACNDGIPKTIDLVLSGVADGADIGFSNPAVKDWFNATHRFTFLDNDCSSVINGPALPGTPLAVTPSITLSHEGTTIKSWVVRLQVQNADSSTVQIEDFDNLENLLFPGTEGTNLLTAGDCKSPVATFDFTDYHNNGPPPFSGAYIDVTGVSGSITPV